MEIVAGLICGAGLLAPLVYGLATLDGLRPKRLYPLLRMKARDGRTLTIKTDWLSPKEESWSRRRI